jgi:hypothetical protein
MAEFHSAAPGRAPGARLHQRPGTDVGRLRADAEGLLASLAGAGLIA